MLLHFIFRVISFSNVLYMKFYLLDSCIVLTDLFPKYNVLINDNKLCNVTKRTLLSMKKEFISVFTLKHTLGICRIFINIILCWQLQKLIITQSKVSIICNFKLQNTKLKLFVMYENIYIM